MRFPFLHCRREPGDQETRELIITSDLLEFLESSRTRKCTCFILIVPVLIISLLGRRFRIKKLRFSQRNEGNKKIETRFYCRMLREGLKIYFCCISIGLMPTIQRLLQTISGVRLVRISLIFQCMLQILSKVQTKSLYCIIF